MSARWRTVRLVAVRELRDRLRRPSYYVVTGVFVVLILAVGVGTRLAGSDPAGPIPVTVTGDAAETVADSLRATATAADRRLELERAASVDEALVAFDDGDTDFVVDTDGHHLIVERNADSTDTAIVHRAWTLSQLQANLADAGLDSAAVRQALAVEPLTEGVRVRPDSVDVREVIAGTLAAALLFISLQIFGGQILSGVVEEKSTAVVEVLLARLRADELLGGKVAGIGVAAMAQFSVLVAAGMASLAISDTEIPSSIWSAIPMALLWYLLGFSLYAMFFALAGSLVSRQEDAAGAAAPVNTALIGAYVVMFTIVANPGSTLARVTSVLPPFAPILMPQRMAAGSASVLEIVTALVLLVVGIGLAWKLTSRVYSQVLLHRGSRVTWARVVGMLRRHDG